MRNPNSFKYAGRVMDDMAKTLADSDIATLLSYAELTAAANDPGKMVRGLQRLGSALSNVKSQLAYGSAAEARMPEKSYREQAAQLVGRMVTLYGRLLRSGALEDEMVRNYTAEKRSLETLLDRLNHRTGRPSKGPLSRGRNEGGRPSQGDEVEEEHDLT